MTHVYLPELCDMVTRVLTSAGAAAVWSTVVADAVLYAEASGITSHGLIRVPYLADQVASGKIDGHAEPDTRWSGASTIRVDAGRGFGYVAATTATAALIDALDRSPIVLAAISNSHHLGVAGRYAEQIAEAGYVGLITTGTAGTLTGGGQRPVLGNPPLALAVPRVSEPPVVIDTAPAVVSRQHIARAAIQGETIPSDWALDGEGVPTADPLAAMAGSLQAIGGHKGIVMAMMLDLLIAVTTSSTLPGEAPAVFAPDMPPPRLGHVLLGFNPAALGIDDAASKVDRYISALLTDTNAVRVPGARRRDARARAQIQGVIVPGWLLDDVRGRITTPDGR